MNISQGSQAYATLPNILIIELDGYMFFFIETYRNSDRQGGDEQWM